MERKKINRLVTVLVSGGLLLTVAGVASAATISYTTNAPGTGFVAINGVPQSASLIDNSFGGQSATLTFIPNTTSNTGVPSNIDLGDFLLVCSTCLSAQTTTFASFTFNLVVTDTTDGATGRFVGTSVGGVVSNNSSTIQLNWQSPLQIGPGTSNALTGNFGQTEFNLVSPVSLIVAPNSGSPQGDTTIQGQVSSAPEPGTLTMAGGTALLGLTALLKRRRTLRATNR